jgi:DNA polymerase III, delta subunit
MLLDLSILKAHSDTVEQLTKLIDRKQIPHALLFSGPFGIGKSSVAEYFAKLVLGESSTYADLHILKPETAMNTYSIDQIRFMQRQSSCTPYEGSFRVFIILEADRLTTQASNAFLKLLEEPPEGNLFILVSSCAYKLLPTLSSRLQKIGFKTPSEDLFDEIMKQKGIDLCDFSFLAGSSFGKAELISKYVEHLKVMASVIPLDYKSNYAFCNGAVLSLDEDKSFNFYEFFPIFEDLMRDFLHHTQGMSSFYKWPELKLLYAPKYNQQALALRELFNAHASGMKVSSCFERFFLLKI